MASVQPPGRDPGAADGAVIPPHLVKLNAVLVEFGMKHYSANGGAASVPGLANLRRILGTSASATPSATLEPPSRAPYTTTEAAAIMRMSASRVRYLAAAGRLIARKAGRDWLIDADSARDYRRTERTR